MQIAGSQNTESTSGTLELLQQDNVIARQITSRSRAGARRDWSSISPSGAAASIEVRLKLSGFDSLTADNTAWLTLPETRPLAVFVPPNRSPAIATRSRRWSD